MKKIIILLVLLVLTVSARETQTITSPNGELLIAIVTMELDGQVANVFIPTKQLVISKRVIKITNFKTGRVWKCRAKRILNFQLTFASTLRQRLNKGKQSI